MAILPVGMSGETGGYQIARSLRFNSADSAYLNRTPASAGNRQIWTWSGWVKRSLLGSFYHLFSGGAGNPTAGTDYGTTIRFTSSDTLEVFDYTNAGFNFDVVTTQVFRDPSSWYHIVVAMDTPQATSTNRLKVYINGTQVTTFGTTSYPSQNFNTNVNTTNPHAIGALTNDTPGFQQYFNGYMADVYFIDGSALTPSSFGETDDDTGVWKPKAYTGSYGTNGFHLDFSDNSSTTALGYDAAGSNDWTPNNFSVTAGAGNDSLVDTPTPYGTDTGAGGEVRGNYAVLNALSIVANASLSNGNLDATNTSGSNYRTFVSTIAIPSGSWYCEFTAGANTSGDNMFVGICPASAALSSTYIGSSATSYAYSSNGTKYNNASATSYGATYTNGDVIGVAFDGSTLTFYKNGTSQGSAFTGLSGDFVFGVSLWGTAVCTVNFGQRPFAYTAPSGFKALCTQNLPEPTVVQGDDYFNTVLYTGNGTSQSITGLNFSPDLVWTKQRSAASEHGLFDTNRGASRFLGSSTTSAEIFTSGAYVTSFDSNGFSVGLGNVANDNGNTYVAWNWRGSDSSAVTNTAGTITSTVSANTTSGFSIVTFTTDNTTKTVGHGLGVKPSIVLVKSRSVNGNWLFITDILGSMQYGVLNSTAAFTSIAYNPPTSTVFEYNDNSGVTQVAYCFAPVAGYSAFGSYTGNGSADGPFVYTGFRPAFVLIKRSSASGEGWWIYDNKRDTFNIVDNILEANSSGAEISGGTYPVDFVSNGFKIRGLNALLNTSGATYIYAAFAESPFKYSLAR